MTRVLAAPSLRPPRSLRTSLSWLSLLCGVTLASCGGDVGDLFAASEGPLPLPSGEPSPTRSGMSSPSDGAPTDDVPASAGASSETSAQAEALPVPTSLDDGDEDGVNDGDPTAVASEPVDEAPEEPTDADPAPPATTPSNETGARACASLATPMLLDFEAVGDTAQALFGDFDAVLSGGTYVYPLAPLAAPAGAGAGVLNGPVRGLISDVTAGDWRISGSVIEQAGFGLFLDCQLLDASRFAGLAFRISGNVGNSDTVTLLVGTAGNEVSSAWRIANGGEGAPSSGRCVPAQSEYDGTCNQARIDIEVSAEARDVFVPFAALGGGSPEPGVNPAEVTTLGWALPPPVITPLSNVVPYRVDLHIDDIRFVEAPR